MSAAPPRRGVLGPVLRAPGRRWLGLALALTAAVFAPALGAGFIDYDDPSHVLENPLIRDLSPGGVWRLFTSAVLGMYMPVTLLSYALEYAAAGTTPELYHATNLVLHLGSTALLLALLRGWVGSGPAACAGALVFAIHPLRVESVVWVAERKDVLCTFFYLAALAAHPRAGPAASPRRQAGSLALFALALLSKGMAVSLPLVLLARDHYEGRLSRSALREKAPHLALAALFGGLLLFTQYHAGAQAGPAWERAWAGFHNLTFYLEKTLLPTGLALFYPEPAGLGPAHPRVWLSWLLAPALLGLGIALRRRLPELLFGLLFAGLAAAPVLGFVPIPGEAVAADRYTYLPSVGLAIAVAGALARAARAASRPQRHALAGLAAAALAVLAGLTVQRIAVWREGSEALWQEVRRLYPRAGTAYGHLANLRYEEAPAEALALYTRALELGFERAAVYRNRGKLRLERGEARAARADLERAVALEPRDPDAHVDLARAQLALGETRAALASCERAGELAPDSVAPPLCRAQVHARAGRPERALAAYDAALERAPGATEARFNRAVLRMRRGDRAGALADVERVLAERPGWERARALHARLRARTGRAEAPPR